MAPRQRGLLVVTRSAGDGAGGKSTALRVHRVCPGFRRRALDYPSRARFGGAGGCAFGGAVHAVSFAPGTYLRRETAQRDAPEVRRSHRTQSARTTQKECFLNPRRNASGTTLSRIVHPRS